MTQFSLLIAQALYILGTQITFNLHSIDIANLVVRLSSTIKHRLLHIHEGGNNGSHKFHIDRQQNFEVVHDGKKHVQISTIPVLAPLKLFFLSQLRVCLCIFLGTRMAPSIRWTSASIFRKRGR